MRRVWLVIVSASLVIAVGCGQKLQEADGEDPREDLEYDRRLKKNLMDPPSEKKFQDLAIYVRAPKEEALAKTGQLPVAEGQFDLDASFNDKTDATLHVLARVKMPKKAPAKGGAAASASAGPGRVRRRRRSASCPASSARPRRCRPRSSAEEVTPRTKNRFKRLIFTAGDKEVRLYTYKEGSHEVALIFVYDPKLKGPDQLEDRALPRFVRRPARRRRRPTRAGNPTRSPTAAPVGPM